MAKRLITVDDVCGAWAIMPTPAKSTASDWREKSTVDLDESSRAIDNLITAGVDGILSLGTLGECATLTWEEKREFIVAAVETVNKRVPFFVGTTTLNTRDTIEQTQQAYALGADGVMLGVPMWCAMDVSAAVQFYRDVAEACPDMAICVYANAQAFNFDFPRPFWAQVANIPQVVSSKYLGIGQLTTDLNLTKRKIRFLPIDMDYYAAARISPDLCKAFWSSGAVCGPAPTIYLRDEIIKAKASGDWSKAKIISDEIGASLAPLIPQGSLVEFGKYNIALEKARMDSAGWIKAGPVRPPYHIVPEIYLDGARQSGSVWAGLHQKYSK